MPVRRVFVRACLGVLLAAPCVLTGEPLSSRTRGAAAPAAVAEVAPLASPTPGAARPTTAAGADRAARRKAGGHAKDPGSFVVLCYHQFGDQPAGERRELYKISKEEFRWQMQYLKDQGIVPVTLGRVRDYLERGTSLPVRSVLITFDDGFRSIYTDAFPVLKEFGFTAVLFLYTEFLTAQNAALRYDEVREMMKSGFEIGSHGEKHLNLARESTSRTPEDFRVTAIQEMHRSARILEEKFGVLPRAFAYPYGVYTETVNAEARRLGYELAFTINPGPNDRTIDRWRIRRHLVTYFTRRSLFKELFRPRVLHLADLEPADGGVIWTERPVISAFIGDPIDPKTLRSFMGQRSLPCRYDPRTRKVEMKAPFALRHGGHQTTLSARDLDGIERTYSWYFRVERKKSKASDRDESLIPADPGPVQAQGEKVGKLRTPGTGESP